MLAYGITRPEKAEDWQDARDCRFPVGGASGASCFILHTGSGLFKVLLNTYIRPRAIDGVSSSSSSPSPVESSGSVRLCHATLFLAVRSVRLPQTPGRKEECPTAVRNGTYGGRGSIPPNLQNITLRRVIPFRYATQGDSKSTSKHKHGACHCSLSPPLSLFLPLAPVRKAATRPHTAESAT